VAVVVAVAVSVRVRVGVGVGVGVGLGLCAALRLVEGSMDDVGVSRAGPELVVSPLRLARDDKALLTPSPLGGDPLPQATKVMGAAHKRAAKRSRRMRQILGR